MFGNNWVRRQYTPELLRLYPDFVFLDAAAGELRNYAEVLDPQGFYGADRCVLVQGPPNPLIEASPFIERLIPGTVECVYRFRRPQ